MNRPHALSLAAASLAAATFAAAALAACNTTGLSLQNNPPADGGELPDIDVSDAPPVDLPPPPIDLAQSCPQSQPSLQTVTLEITNASAADRWVVTQGQECTPFAIDALYLALRYQVICEGPPPPTPMATYYTHLAPGATVSLSWDARSLALCSQSVDCATRGWPGAGIQTYFVGVASPVDSGAHLATVAYESAAPSSPNCFMQTNGDVSCNPGFGGPFPGGGGTAQDICSATSYAQAGFTLPPAGDTTVAIAIP